MVPKLLLLAGVAVLALSACREEAGPKARITTIDFPDPNMKACAETTEAEFVDEVISLDCLGFGIFDLTGIQNFTNLRSVNFTFNDLAPYTDGTGATVAALEPLRNLTSLEFIAVLGNQGLRDAEPLGALPNLVSLNMGETNLDDAGLAGFNTTQLTSLELLYLSDNFAITDVSPLASLTTLTFLNLGADVSMMPGNITMGVASLTTLVNADTIILEGHPVPCTDIDTLRAALTTTDVVNGACP